MKFDCGDSGKAKRRRLEAWHPWFAWHPVRLADHDCRWLEYVERKGTRHQYEIDTWWVFEYRALDGAAE